MTVVTKVREVKLSTGQHILIPHGVKSVVMRAKVTRCACGDPTSHIPNPCPQGIEGEEKVIAYWHRNPLRRIAWRIKNSRSR